MTETTKRGSGTLVVEWRPAMSISRMQSSVAKLFSILAATPQAQPLLKPDRNYQNVAAAISPKLQAQLALNFSSSAVISPKLQNPAAKLLQHGCHFSKTPRPGRQTSPREDPGTFTFLWAYLFCLIFARGPLSV
ncbi:hypothetical protein GBA52_009097 [Prunus armeniaca]|nr:hypothetical protein GBA52_009097 [Prunus armeniaca]